MKWNKLGITSDHAGFEMKEQIKEYLLEKGYMIKDFGPNSAESCDYPDFAHPLAYSVSKKESEIGIAFCGSGNGINMTLNKHQQIRSAVCWNLEISSLARSHNDANICSLPARFVSYEEAKKIVDIFLNTEFEGGRHIKRINKIPIK